MASGIGSRRQVLTTCELVPPARPRKRRETDRVCVQAGIGGAYSGGRPDRLTRSAMKRSINHLKTLIDEDACGSIAADGKPLL